MNNTNIAIHVANLSKTLGDRVILRNIHLEVAEGEYIALIGSNGAGKTTLLRCLAGAVRPNTGEVRWYGQLARVNPRGRRRVGMVAHESRLYQHMTLRENLMFAARMCKVCKPAYRVDQLLEEIELKPLADCLPRRISKGMRQRLSIARATVHDPLIVLLDEPFSGLDVKGTEWLSELLANLRRRRRTICFATHDKEKSGRLADRVLQLRAGQLREVVTPIAAAVTTDTAQRDKE